MRDRLAIITSGGGMACSYSAGVILALVEKFKLTDPDIVIGGSGSIGTLSYYVSKQYSSIKNIWLNLLSTPKFINQARFWRIIDIDYLIDEVFKRQDPLNIKKVYSSKIHYLIAATSKDTGKVEYFSNKKKDDILEAMRASAAVPIIYNKIVRINKKKYCDTLNSSSIGLNIIKAVKLGANKLIVIDNATSTKVGDYFYNKWLLFQNKTFKKNYNKECKKREFIAISNGIDIIYLRPKKKLKIEILDHDQDELRKTFNKGYNETVNDKKLKKFLIFS